MSFIKRHRIKLVISFVFATMFIWLLEAGALPFLPDQTALGRFKWWTLGVYVALWTVVHWLRAVRWHFLLAPIQAVPMGKLLCVSFIGFAAIVVLPVRAGEVVRPAMIRQKGALSGWSAMGTVAAERIVDGLVLSLMLLYGILVSDTLSPLPDRIGHLPVSPKVVPAGTYLALAVFGSAFLVMGLFYFQRLRMRRLTRAVVGLVSERLANWLADRVERVTLGLSFLPQFKYTIPFMAITVAYWMLNAAATWLLGWGAGFALTYPQSCVLAGVLALGIMVPNAPGFFGAFQFSVYAGLSMFFGEAQLLSDGSVLVFLLYVSQLLIMLIAALISAAFLKTSFGAALQTEQGALETHSALEPIATASERRNLA